MTKKFENKVTQLISLDRNLWKEFSTLRQPYGTINELFEDYVRILLAKQPKHYEILSRLQKVIPILLNEVKKEELIHSEVSD